MLLFLWHDPLVVPHTSRVKRSWDSATPTTLVYLGVPNNPPGSSR